MAAMEGSSAQEDIDERGFHNPLFTSTTGSVAVAKDKSMFPVFDLPSPEDGGGGAKDEDFNNTSSSLVMRRHSRKDGRNEGTIMDTTRTRQGVSRPKKTSTERQLRRVSSLDVPACVVVKQGDASDAGEILQHSAFHMEAFKVKAKNQAPGSTTLLFVFHSGKPNQASLEITHTMRRDSASAGTSDPDGILGKLPPSPSNGEGRVTMTLGGKSVPHLPGEPYSCHIHQVGNVTFNPRRQARGYLYILSQEGRTLFTSLS